MSLADEDTDVLIKRRVLLDSTVMNLCMAGVEVPPEVAQEFEAVQDELIRRGKNTLPDRPRSWTSWLGKKFDDYTIEYLVEEGLYWYLFHASGPENSEPDGAGAALIKVAKEANLYGAESGKLKYATRLFAIEDDIVREVQPAQNVFIQSEIRRLVATTNSAIPVIDQESTQRDCQYYRTPHIPGDSLRQLLLHCDAREASFSIVSMFSQIAATLEDLCADPSFVYHGNLKPDNIIFTAGGVSFRELGSFGPMRCGDVLENEVRITTPQYYPWLDVDDIGALGISLWEALVDYHPFDDSRAPAGESIVSSGLRALIDLELSLSNIFVLPLLNIKRPHEFGVRTSEKLERVLFKSIKLRLGEDGLIHEDAGYESIAQFNQDLLGLLNEPQMIF
jgi:serine/threonine protein kinase